MNVDDFVEWLNAAAGRLEALREKGDALTPAQQCELLVRDGLDAVARQAMVEFVIDFLGWILPEDVPRPSPQ